MGKEWADDRGSVDPLINVGLLTPAHIKTDAYNCCYLVRLSRNFVAYHLSTHQSISSHLSCNSKCAVTSLGIFDEMDLQKTKEAQRDPHATPDESSEDPLETRHSESSPKNDPSLDHHHDSESNEDIGTLNSSRQSAFSYVHTTPQKPQSPVQPNSGVQAQSSEIVDIPDGLDLGVNAYRLLKSAREQPTVTKESMRELDLPCIINNINLRMDANFDRDLHFKPALDGEKGKIKRREGDDYWDAMAAEICVYEYKAHRGLESCNDTRNNINLGRTFTPRLPSMFKALQDVLKTLVPERDIPSVMQNLDVSLMMQQVRKGVLDMVGLANWLAALLKTHCAPMRDEWADSMVQEITVGSQSQNPREIVNGLKTLFGILEAMKLVKGTTSTG